MVQIADLVATAEQSRDLSVDSQLSMYIMYWRNSGEAGRKDDIEGMGTDKDNSYKVQKSTTSSLKNTPV